MQVQWLKTVDVYLAGHDHELQLLDVEGVLEVVSGSGGRESDKVVKLPESLFCAKAFGFAVLEATATQLTIRFARLADKPGTFAYSCNVTRGADGKITQACSKRCLI